MEVATKWQDYELIDASNGEKLERWKDIYLLRPDPSIIWDNGNLKEKYQGKIDAIYHRSNKGGGYWEYLKRVPDRWEIKYNDLTFNLKLMGFKHTGLFPEQAVNWDFLQNKIDSSKKEVRILNLFAYTGGASLACIKSGASVTHVDSSKGMVQWCKENISSSNLDDTKIRYLIDDCIKFVKREIRRGNKYDGIIMDPPSFGRGANKEVWQFEQDTFELIKLCTEILSDDALFFLVSSYSAGISGEVIANMLKLTVNKKIPGKVSASEIGLPITNSDLILPCGNYTRWERNV